MRLPTISDVARGLAAEIDAAKIARDRQLADMEAARRAALKATEAPPPPSPEELARQDARWSLMKFVPWATPAYGSPKHLAPIVDAFERAVRGESMRVCFSAPPQHGKSDTLAHGVGWGLWNAPHLRFGYATYGDALVRDKSLLARRLVRERLGMPLEVKKLGQWDTPEGGGFIATSVRGAFTGKRVNIAVVDDPYKNRIEAESPTVRRTVRDFMNDVVETRLTPDGSCFVFMTRWHPQDLIGDLEREGWTFIRLPALDDSTGEPLWPERWSREALEAKRKRVGEYTWESLYQGRPRARGATVFGPATSISGPAPLSYRSAFGVDLAYAAKTSSNASSCVKVRRHPNSRLVDIVKVINKRCSASQFKTVCRHEHEDEPAARWRWYASSTEEGTADLFRAGDEPVPLIAHSAAKYGDKLTRAQKTAAAWNSGELRVDPKMPGLERFLSVMAVFTGVGDEDDDDVDALVAAYDEVMSGMDDDIESKPARPTARRGSLFREQL